MGKKSAPKAAEANSVDGHAGPDLAANSVDHPTVRPVSPTSEEASKRAAVMSVDFDAILKHIGEMGQYQVSVLGNLRFGRISFSGSILLIGFPPLYPCPIRSHDQRAPIFAGRDLDHAATHFGQIFIQKLHVHIL
jgi:hypothetical protein